MRKLFRSKKKKYEAQKSKLLEEMKSGGLESFRDASWELRNDKEVVLEAVKMDGRAFQYTGNELRNDKEFVLELVKIRGEVLYHASGDLQNDKEFVLEAMKQSHESGSNVSLYHVGRELRKDKEVVLEAVKKRGLQLDHASEELKNDPEVVLEAVKNFGSSLEFASEELKKNEEIVFIAVKRSRGSFRYVHEELKNDKVFVLKAVKEIGGLHLENFGEELRKDKEVVLEAVKRKSYLSVHLSEELLNDPEVVLEAVKNSFTAVEKAGEKLKNDKKFAMEAVKIDYKNLKYFSEEFQNDRELVLEVVRQNGHELERISEELKNDKEIVIEAVKHGGYFLQFASEERKNDKEVVLEAVKKDGRALQFAGEEMKNDKDVVIEAVKAGKHYLRFAGEEAKNNPEVVLESVKNSGSLQYAGEKIRNDKDFVVEAMRSVDNLSSYYIGKEVEKEARKAGISLMEWLKVEARKKDLEEEKRKEVEREVNTIETQLRMKVMDENQKMLDSILDDVGRRFRIHPKNLKIHRDGKLGKGGFSSVFRADLTDEKGEKKEVAAKVIGYGFQTGAGDVFKEFSRSLQFCHENVIRTFGFDDSRRNEIAIVMEKLDGNIHDYVVENVLTLEEKLDIMLQMAKGIKYLHNMKPSFIHRDIKGENFLFKKQNTSEEEDEGELEVKVCDFGLAKAVTDSSKETQISAAGQGTMLWMAPEAGKGMYSVKSDVYSLGITFWEILFEEYPYESLDPNHVFYKVGVEGLRPDLDKYRKKNKDDDDEEEEHEGEIEEIEDGNLPQPLKELLEKCWVGDRKKRMSIQDIILWFEDEGMELGMELGEEYFPPLEKQLLTEKKKSEEKEKSQSVEQIVESLSTEEEGENKENQTPKPVAGDLKGKLKAFVVGQNGDGLVNSYSDGLRMSSELQKMGYKCTEELYKGVEERPFTVGRIQKSFRRFVLSLEDGDRVVFYFSGFGFQQLDGRNFLLFAKEDDEDEVIDRVVKLNFFIEELRKKKTENVFILDFCVLDPSNNKETWNGAYEVGLKPINVEGGFGFKGLGSKEEENSLLRFSLKDEGILTFLKKAGEETKEGNVFFMMENEEDLRL